MQVGLWTSPENRRAKEPRNEAPQGVSVTVRGECKRPSQSSATDESAITR